MNLVDAETVHIYFYDALQSAKDAAVSLSSSRRLKILNQEIKHQDMSSLYGDVELVSDATFAANPLFGDVHPVANGVKKNRKHFGIYQGWEQILVNSPFNDKKYIHAQFYEGITAATATGVALSQVRFEIVSKQVNE
jgi:hypothetical protein